MMFSDLIWFCPFPQGTHHGSSLLPKSCGERWLWALLLSLKNTTVSFKKGSNRLGESPSRNKGQYKEGRIKMLPILTWYHHFSATRSGVSKKTLKNHQDAYWKLTLRVFVWAKTCRFWTFNLHLSSFYHFLKSFSHFGLIIYHVLFLLDLWIGTPFFFLMQYSTKEAMNILSSLYKAN